MDIPKECEHEDCRIVKKLEAENARLRDALKDIANLPSDFLCKTVKDYASSALSQKESNHA